MAFMQSMFEAYVKSQKKAYKRLKLDNPLGTIYLSTEPHPIKVADTAPSETTRADEVAIETAKTGKVTAVVA
jgi:hypothetical protein